MAFLGWERLTVLLPSVLLPVCQAHLRPTPCSQSCSCLCVPWPGLSPAPGASLPSWALRAASLSLFWLEALGLLGVPGTHVETSCQLESAALLPSVSILWALGTGLLWAFSRFCMLLLKASYCISFCLNLPTYNMGSIPPTSLTLQGLSAQLGQGVIDNHSLWAAPQRPGVRHPLQLSLPGGSCSPVS